MAHEIVIEHCIDKRTQYWRPVVALRSADPSAYLDRLDLFNRVFEDDVRFEGIVRLEPENVSLVTSQPLVLGTTPTRNEVAAFMRALDFREVREPTTLPGSDAHFTCWYRPTDGVVAADAKPANFIKSMDGELYAIDLITKQVDEPGLLDEACWVKLT